MGPERSFVFEVPENYQSVYRKVLEQARRCYQTGRSAARMVVQGDLQDETRLGTVVVAVHNALADETYQVIDIVAVDDKQTRVIGRYLSGSVEKYGQALKEWVLDNSSECGPKIQ